MRTLLDGIPLEQMNTSMTINATAAWLLALYVAVAESRARIARSSRARPKTTSSRNICRAAPTCSARASLRLIADTILFTSRDAEMESDQRVLLPPAGGRSDAGAGGGVRAGHRAAVLDAVRPARLRRPLRSVFGRISFFVNAGLRFITEICKMRAFSVLWDEMTAALWRHGREHAVPLWRAGEFSGAHRAAS